MNRFLLLLAALGLLGCIDSAPSSVGGPNNGDNNGVGSNNGGSNNGGSNNGGSNNGGSNNGGTNNGVTNNGTNNCTPKSVEDFLNDGSSVFDCGTPTLRDGCGGEVEVEFPGCPENEACNDFVCGCPCDIDEQCYPEGARQATGCGICSPSDNSTDWTMLEDGEACEDDSLCTDTGICTRTGCEAPPTKCDDLVITDPCMVPKCDETIGCVAVKASAETICGTSSESCIEAMTCNEAGECVPTIAANRCFIGGKCYYNGVFPGEEDCRFCDASESQIAFTPTPGDSCLLAQCSEGICGASGTCIVDATIMPESLDGTTCSRDLCIGQCYSGSCEVMSSEPSCLISGTGCVSDATYNPNNNCQVCETSNSVTGWTIVANSTSCKSNNGTDGACQSGACITP